MAKGIPSIEEFDELKKEFAKAKNFGDFWDRFLDNWVGRPAFMEMGEPTENAKLASVITMTCDRMLGCKTNPQMMQLVAIPEVQMIHGAYIVKGGIGSIIYFGDIAMGMVAVVIGERTEFVRFGLTMEKGPVQ